jgi:membrane fusion protein, heavy metal efflux system
LQVKPFNINVMKNHRSIGFLFLLTALFLLSACGSQDKAKPEEHAEVIPDDIVELRGDQIKVAGVETGPLELRALSGTLRVTGIVATAPQNMATVCMPMGGYVKSTSLIPGQAVRKGQLLAILESQEYVDLQQKYLEARNNLEFAEAEYTRHSELFKDDVYSQKNLQQVTTNYRNLKAQVKAFEQKLSLIGIDPANLHEDEITGNVSLVSPIDGFVKTANANPGKYASPSDVLFEIVNSDNLFLELTLFEKDADKVSIGQNIRFFINNETEQHDAVIYQTAKSIGSDKTFKVYARVQGQCRNVLPGMYVSAVIETSGNKVPSLPSEAVVSFDDKDYIFVYERDKEEDGKPFSEYRMIRVQKGFSDNGFTEIILPEGVDLTNRKIVIKGAYNLLSAKKNAGEMAC